MVFLRFSAFADIMDLLPGRTQVCRIYISVGVQRFKAFQYNLAALICLHPEMNPACQVLPEINHGFPLWSHQHFLRLPAFHLLHLAAGLGRKRLSGKSNRLCRTPAPRPSPGFTHCSLPVCPRIDATAICPAGPNLPLQTGIVALPIVNLRKSNRPGPPLPAFIRHEHFLPAVLIPNCQLHQKCRPCTVIVSQQQKTHLPLIPACPQHGVQPVFSLF